MQPPWESGEDMYILYCKDDGRYIAIANGRANIENIYRALTNNCCVDEHYEYEPLFHWITKNGYPADNIGGRIFFTSR